MAITLASRIACAARAAPRAASRLAMVRCSPPVVGARRGSLSLRRAGGAPGEGSGVEEKWSPVASSDPLFDKSDELVAGADDAAAAAGGRAIVVTLDGGDASFRALDWALKNVARKKGACKALHREWRSLELRGAHSLAIVRVALPQTRSTSST